MQSKDAAADTAPAPKRGRGRPRSTEVEEKIRRAALEALSEDGFQGLNIDRICTRAGVQRTSFYRRWSAPVEVVIDVLRENTGDLRLEDTGDLAADLFIYMKKVVAMHADPIVGVCRGFMATQARIRPDVAEALNESARDTIERHGRDLEAAMRRQGFNSPLHADLILNAIHGVAFSTVAEWRVTDDDMKALIATLLGPTPGAESRAQITIQNC
jgi:AcrR family transcriptional regulator